MAVLHRAELRPTKLELLATWLPRFPWYDGESRPERVASYRFDDPAGAVGVETLIVRAGDGPLVQAPMTYRASPLLGAEAFLIGTLDHSVLGQRWVYDACGDPVYAQTLATTIFTGASAAEEFVDYDGELVRRESTTVVRGSGTPDPPLPGLDSVVRVQDGDPTMVFADGLELAIVRVLDAADGHEPLRLTGTWEGQATPLLLAYARVAMDPSPDPSSDPA
jgi:hypothetical protein